MFAWLKTALRLRRRQQALDFLETLPPWLLDDLGLTVAQLRKLARSGSARTHRGVAPHAPGVFRAEGHKLLAQPGE